MTVVVTRSAHPRLPVSTRRLVGVGREIAIVLALTAMYFGVRGVTESGVDEAVANAERVMHLERTIGILWEPSLQAAIIGSDSAIAVLNWIYIWGHWPVIAAIAAWLIIRHPGEYPVYRNAFAISGAIGIAIFMTFPVAPPRLTDLAVVDTITEYSKSYRVLQPPAFVNQYAAVPSLHFGWDLLLGLALIRVSTVWIIRLFGCLMPVAMLAAIVLTANHYIIDAVVGGAVALTGLAVAEAVHRRRRGAPESSESSESPAELGAPTAGIPRPRRSVEDTGDPARGAPSRSPARTPH